MNHLVASEDKAGEDIRIGQKTPWPLGNRASNRQSISAVLRGVGEFPGGEKGLPHREVRDQKIVPTSNLCCESEQLLGARLCPCQFPSDKVAKSQTEDRAEQQRLLTYSLAKTAHSHAALFHLRRRRAGHYDDEFVHRGFEVELDSGAF